MEPPSGPARRRCAPCNRVLLSASLLTFWTPPTTTQLTIETVPPLAAEGSNVLLHAHNVTEKTLRYSWYREERVETIQLIASYGVATNLITNGPEHSGRETLYPNGTLLIQNITQKDTGSYTLLILKFDLQTGQTGHLHVHHKPTPESSSDLSAGAIVGIVAVVALIAALMYFLYIRETRRSSHSDSSPEKVNEVEYSSLNFNAQELNKKATAASPSPIHTETIYSEVKKQ
ncbi:carcinoembryonic antigen-related cell adhesion molecule 3-like isoform X6 [Cervus canadensis]|uniref:carcinoembryonic antigen-related cell adhesion molecule 3-like isoform X6 n=1 Tax=Cervus canadensis TaxID=1574408 RepID=UPI001CA338F8|nr:carcinoembryonic antigen-related cell adhesion molecule 3-like isoform X6 [Cervus canadensis]